VAATVTYESLPRRSFRMSSARRVDVRPVFHGLARVVVTDPLHGQQRRPAGRTFSRRRPREAARCERRSSARQAAGESHPGLRSRYRPGRLQTVSVTKLVERELAGS